MIAVLPRLSVTFDAFVDDITFLVVVVRLIDTVTSSNFRFSTEGISASKGISVVEKATKSLSEKKNWDHVAKYQ